MTVMAAVCGVMIVLLGFWSTGRNPTDAQSAVEIICLVGGLILCFIAVVLARLQAIALRLDGFEVAEAGPAGDEPDVAEEAPATPDARSKP